MTACLIVMVLDEGFVDAAADGSVGAEVYIDPEPEIEPTQEPQVPSQPGADVPEEMSNQPVVQDEVRRRTNELWRCRFMVAMDHRVPVTDVLAGEVDIQFEIVPGGWVESASVVALTPTHPDVLICARQQMEQWVFEDFSGDAPVTVHETISLQLPVQQDQQDPSGDDETPPTDVVE